MKIKSYNKRMNESNKNSYYYQGIEAEKKRAYLKAIDFYLLATIEDEENISEIYENLSFVLYKKNFYEASCDAFLLKENINIDVEKNSLEIEANNQLLLYEYFYANKIFSSSEWLTFSKKAESLKCWTVVVYAYNEFLNRNEKFDCLFHQKLAHSYLLNSQYKEASFSFQAKKMHVSLREFPLEERIIFYESSLEKESIDELYYLYRELNKDAHFDAYKHIFTLNKLDVNFEILNESNTIFINKETDLYYSYLARAKYLISTQSFSESFKRKPQQLFLFLGEKNELPIEATHLISKSISLQETIQEIFFQNKKIAFELHYKNKTVKELYASAINDLEKELWKSAYDKFIKVKKSSTDIVLELPTLYYIKESKFREELETNTQPIEETLYYKQYRFTAENFVGVEYLLDKAVLNSEQNREKWNLILTLFKDILEDIKRNKTKNIRSIADKTFLTKTVRLSNEFDKNLEADKLPYQTWFLFANLFIFARQYKQYQLAREKALESVMLLKETNNINLLRYKLNAFVEINDTENYTLLRDKMKKNSSEYIKKELQLLGSSEVYFGHKNEAVEFYKPFYNNDEKDFSEYINHKTIALIGPVNAKLNLGKEIDSHDVVLRFNYKGLDNSLKKDIGTKTNLSFYISEILVPNTIDIEKISKMNELDWVIFDKAHKKESVCFMGMTQKSRAGYFSADAFSNPYVKGTPSGIQRAILDLLRFNIGKIKIYNTNLFLDNTYDKDYKSRGSLGADHLNFIWHDPLSNFIFLKRLKENGIIETDEVLTQILKLTPVKYIEELEKRYARIN